MPLCPHLRISLVICISPSPSVVESTSNKLDHASLKFSGVNIYGDHDGGMHCPLFSLWRIYCFQVFLVFELPSRLLLWLTSWQPCLWCVILVWSSFHWWIIAPLVLKKGLSEVQKSVYNIALLLNNAVCKDLGKSLHFYPTMRCFLHDSLVIDNLFTCIWGWVALF